MNNNHTKKRIREIVSIFIKHGFKNRLGNPKELRLALEELGPSFVKIGQILSTRPDILPIEYITELQNLQDNVKPENFDIMKEVIESELKGPINKIFLDFKETPIASASLSEVFWAKLMTGKEIVVKVQKPFVKNRMLSDIRILKKLVPFMDITPTKNIVDMRKVIEDLSTATKKELNFLNEMENIIRFSEYNKNVKFITCPQVYEKYCTEKILVMDYISGIKIDNIDKLQQDGYDMHDIATKITYNYFKQIFEDGYFHADPHPGNILIHNNTIGYIDFGLMGNLSPNLRKKMNQLLEGAATKNITLIIKSLLAIGIKKGTIDMDNLYRDIEIFYDSYIDESINDFNLSKVLEETIIIAKKNNIGMPHNITLLAKGLLTLQAVLANIDKGLTIMDIATPYFRDKIFASKIKELNPTEIIMLLYSSIKSTAQLPTKLIEFLESGLQGRLRFSLELKDSVKTFNMINKMVNRLVFAIIVAGLLVSSSLVINANVGLQIYGISAIGIFGYLGAGLAGLLLLISIIRSGKL